MGTMDSKGILEDGTFSPYKYAVDTMQIMILDYHGSPSQLAHQLLIKGKSIIEQGVFSINPPINGVTGPFLTLKDAAKMLLFHVFLNKLKKLDYIISHSNTNDKYLINVVRFESWYYSLDDNFKIELLNDAYSLKAALGYDNFAQDCMIQMKSVNLFNPNSRIGLFDFVLIVGKRATGKTALMNDLIRDRKELYSSYIHFDPIEQKECCDEDLDNISLDHNSRLVIIDNAIFNLHMLRHTSPLSRIVQDKHTGVILTMTYPTSMDDAIKRNLKCVFLLKDTNTNNQRSMYNQYGKDVFRTFEEFLEYYLSATAEPYSSLVIEYGCDKINTYKYKVIM